MKRGALIGTKVTLWLVVPLMLISWTVPIVALETLRSDKRLVDILHQYVEERLASNALAKLGPDYRFRTEMYRTGRLRGHVYTKISLIILAIGMYVLI